MPPIEILADDLTGACDTAAAFAGPGLRVVVALGGSLPRADVVVVSTASRNDSEDAAYAKVRAACERLSMAGIFYKKIDSVLRGPVAAEVRACIDAGARTPAICCPAFPGQGRVVENGVVRAPGRTVDLREMLADLDVEIADASSQADLDRIAAEALARDPVPMLVGSAGLARAVAARLTRGRVLLFVGSDHEVTRGQLDRLRESGRKDYEVRTVDFHNPPDPSEFASMIRGGLFLCGGDTAAWLCEAWGVTAISIEGEVEPGIPLGRLSGGPAGGLAVVTKSGGFGGPESLGSVVDLLSRQNRKTDC